MLELPSRAHLRIISSGICCSVGFNGPAARVAIRSGLDRFHASHFVDNLAQPLTVADVPLGDVRGPRRLGMMCEMVLSECLASTRGVDPAATVLFLLLPELDRPGYNGASEAACLSASRGMVNAPFHPESRIWHSGRAGVGEALRSAKRLLLDRRVRHVLIVGVDSYLTPQTINHFLAHGRLFSTGVSQGFIPGEGAAALLMDLAGPYTPGLHVLGIGTAEEPARPEGEGPMRGTGRTRAIRDALAESGHRMSDLGFQMADLNGEPFYSHELALATTRTFDRKIEAFPLLCLAESLGETGAAAGPLSLAYLVDVMKQGHTPGTRAILHFANDDGRRTSLIVEHQPGLPAPPSG